MGRKHGPKIFYNVFQHWVCSGAPQGARFGAPLITKVVRYSQANLLTDLSDEFGSVAQLVRAHP